MTDHVADTADAFVTANDASPVVSGTVRPPGGKGGRFRLADGREFSLSVGAMRQLPPGYPKWKEIA